MTSNPDTRNRREPPMVRDLDAAREAAMRALRRSRDAYNAELDEAYMQDAVASSKENGVLYEQNPQDAPASVLNGGSDFSDYARPQTKLPSVAEQASPEDKAFSHVERLQVSREAQRGDRSVS